MCDYCATKIAYFSLIEKEMVDAYINSGFASHYVKELNCAEFLEFLQKTDRKILSKPDCQNLIHIKLFEYSFSEEKEFTVPEEYLPPRINYAFIYKCFPKIFDNHNINKYENIINNIHNISKKEVCANPQMFVELFMKMMLCHKSIFFNHAQLKEDYLTKHPKLNLIVKDNNSEKSEEYDKIYFGFRDGCIEYSKLLFYTSIIFNYLLSTDIAEKKSLNNDDFENALLLLNFLNSKPEIDLGNHLCMWIHSQLLFTYYKYILTIDKVNKTDVLDTRDDKVKLIENILKIDRVNKNLILGDRDEKEILIEKISYLVLNPDTDIRVRCYYLLKKCGVIDARVLDYLYSVEMFFLKDKLDALPPTPKNDYKSKLMKLSDDSIGFLSLVEEMI